MQEGKTDEQKQHIQDFKDDGSHSTNMSITDKEKQPIQDIKYDGSHSTNISIPVDQNAKEGGRMTAKETLYLQYVASFKRDFVHNAKEGDIMTTKENMHVPYVASYKRNFIHDAIEGGRMEKMDYLKGEDDHGSFTNYAGWWWAFLNASGFTSVVIDIIFMISEFAHDKELSRMLDSCFAPIHLLYGFFIIMVQMRYRGMRDRLVGCLGKVVLDMIALCAALVLRQHLPYDGSEFGVVVVRLLVAFTLYLHSWGQLLHLAGDIALRDVLAEMIMEVVVCISGSTTCFFVVFSFCAVICYKFFSYSVPVSIENIKKDLESLPC